MWTPSFPGADRKSHLEFLGWRGRARAIGRERERKRNWKWVEPLRLRQSLSNEPGRRARLCLFRPPDFISTDNRQGAGGCGVGHILNSNVPPSRFLLIRAESDPTGRLAT